MLSHIDIVRFYTALGETPHRHVDANEIERLMLKIMERYGVIVIIPHLSPKPDRMGIGYIAARQSSMRDPYHTAGDTIAEAIARWVLAQEEEG